MSGPAAVDYSFARPAPSALRAAGYQGVVRYLDWLPNPKVIDGAELAALHAAGLSVALVWESVAQRASSGGQAGGKADATEALRQADALGFPADRPVYFVLEDPNVEPASDWVAIEAYLAGVAEVFPVSRIGGYGSQRLVEAMVTGDRISWGWQVEGWSTSVSPLCNLYQRLQVSLDPRLAGQVDEDAILEADWGAWDPPPPASSGPDTVAFAEGIYLARVAGQAEVWQVFAGCWRTPVADPADEHALLSALGQASTAVVSAATLEPIPARTKLEPA